MIIFYNYYPQTRIHFRNMIEVLKRHLDFGQILFFQ